MLKSVFQAVRQQVVEVMSMPKHHIHNVVVQPLERLVQEVEIPVPWGHIAGKWWGSQSTRPILCLHGFQDNAGTFDTLAPLLPHEISILAVDMPGHGLSSHIPKGNAYHVLDLVLIIRRIASYYGWDKVSLMGHSFGSIQGFLYSAIYPEQVEHYIALDAFKMKALDPTRKMKNHGKELDKFLQLEALDLTTKPTYTYDEAVDRLHSNIKNWLSREGCEILTRRGTIKMPDGKVCFRGDPRLKTFIDLGYTDSAVLKLAANLQCKVLNIKAKQGLTQMKGTEEFLDIVKNAVPVYEYHTVEGLHHVHLDFPERVAPIISNFLKSK